MNVTSSDVGIEIAVISVARTEKRKKKMTSTAKARPSSPSVTSVSIDCWMNGAWSSATVTVTSSPSAASISGSTEATACDTSTVFAEGRFVTDTVSASSPLTREIEVIGA